MLMSTPSSLSSFSSKESIRCEQCDLTFTNLQYKEEHVKLEQSITSLTEIKCEKPHHAGASS
jgi:hypothetical protein